MNHTHICACASTHTRYGNHQQSDCEEVSPTNVLYVGAKKTDLGYRHFSLCTTNCPINKGEFSWTEQQTHSSNTYHYGMETLVYRSDILPIYIFWVQQFRFIPVSLLQHFNIRRIKEPDPANAWQESHHSHYTTRDQGQSHFFLFPSLWHIFFSFQLIFFRVFYSDVHGVCVYRSIPGWQRMAHYLCFPRCKVAYWLKWQRRRCKTWSNMSLN